MMQLQDLDLLKDIPGYRAILRAVLKTQIQLLVEQLSEQTGEESVILTASVSDGTLCHLGSFSGKDFLEGREEIKSQFLHHCLKKQHRHQREDVHAPYPKERRMNTYPSLNSSTESSLGKFGPGRHARPFQTHAKLRTKHSQSFPSRTNPGLELPLQTDAMELPSDLTFPLKDNKNQSKNESLQIESFATNDFVVKPENLSMNNDNGCMQQRHSISSYETADTGQSSEKMSKNSNDNLNLDKETGVNGSVESEDNLTEESGSTIIVKQEPSEDDIQITGMETNKGRNQTVYGSEWVPALLEGQDFRTNMAAGINLYGNDSFGSGEDQSFSGYTAARFNTKGDNSNHPTDTNDHHFDLDLCNTTIPRDKLLFDVEQFHKLSKKFPCEQCGKSFSQKCDLKRHLVIHTGERFYCSMCTKSFSQKHQRNLHELTHQIELN